MKQAMNGVMMLVNKFPPLPAGGAEKQAERLAEYMAAHSVDVGVLTRGAQGLPSYERRKGYWISRIPQHGPGKLKMVTFTVGAMLALFRHRRSYSVLHAHLAFAPAVAAAIMGRLLGKRVIVKFGNSGPFGDVQVSQGSARGRLKLALLRRWVDVNIALDAEMEAELLAAGFARQRVRRMVNGIDTTAFQTQHDKPAAKAALGLADKTVLLFVGRLVPQKALPSLFIALQQALIQCPQLHLVLLGQGEDRAALEQLAHELDLDSHITFAGNVDNVHQHLDATDIFVLPSLAEGISNALLEAMATGLPCIATAVGGTPEVLDNGRCGILLPPNQPTQLANAIIELSINSDKAARLGAAARDRIMSHYAFTVVGDLYRTLYEQLFQSTAASPINSQFDRVEP